MSLGVVVSPFNKDINQLSNIYASIYLGVLDLNCTICKDSSDYIRSVFPIIKFAVDANHFQINLIAYSVLMRDSLGVFSDIINVYLALLHSSYKSPVYD